MRHIVGILLLISALGLSACEPKLRLHGYVPRASEIEQLKTGISDKAFVVSTIGSPSFVNDFADNRWHYVSFQTSQVGAEHPEILRYQVLQLVFDERNVLAELNLYDKDDLILVELDPDFTPAFGRTMTITEQIIGNIGKFN
jgi:outer membrane protein assembly factor BamE (lipoprotein component of BamABCDE complex)